MKRRIKFRLASIFFIVLLLVTAFSAVFVITEKWRNMARAKLDRPEAIALYEALGAAMADQSNDAEPSRLEPELDLARLVAHVEVFGELLQEAVVTPTDIESHELNLLLGGDLPDLSPEKLRQMAELNQSLLGKVRVLAAEGGPVYPLDFSKGPAMELPHLRPMRHWAEMLHADAFVASENGDVDRVVDDIIAITQLGEALAVEPIVISQLVRMKISTIAYDAMRALPRGTLDPSDYERLIAVLAQADHREAFASSIAGEAAIWSMILNDPHRNIFMEKFFGFDYFSQSGLKRLYARVAGRPQRMMDEAALLNILTPLNLAAAQPFYESRPDIEAIRESAQDLSPARILSRSMLPALTRANLFQACHEAMLDLAQLGLAVEALRNEHGAFPQALDEVAARVSGRIPVDPHTGQPYFYRPSENSFLLYSVGMNLTDDGGHHHVVRGDIVWRGVREEP